MFFASIFVGISIIREIGFRGYVRNFDRKFTIIASKGCGLIFRERALCYRDEALARSCEDDRLSRGHITRNLY